MTTRTVLVATWGDRLFVITGENRHHELAGQPVSALASDEAECYCSCGPRKLKRVIKRCQQIISQPPIFLTNGHCQYLSKQAKKSGLSPEKPLDQ